jgi:hypothetical protein
MKYFENIFTVFLHKILLFEENYKISENNIINVEAAKVVGYLETPPFCFLKDFFNSSQSGDHR